MARNNNRKADTIIVLDFETTGLSPDGGRAIENGAVRIEQGVVTDRFQSLMNHRKRVAAFIKNLGVSLLIIISIQTIFMMKLHLYLVELR